MERGKNSIANRWRHWLRGSMVAMLLLTLSIGISAAGLLPAGNAITDGESILRYALPIDNKPVRELQNSLEDISNHLRGKQWSTIAGDVKKAQNLLKNKQADILKALPEAKQAQAQTLLSEVQTDIEAVGAAATAQNWRSRSSDGNRVSLHSSG
jgi:peptidylprolyl isomerase